MKIKFKSFEIDIHNKILSVLVIMILAILSFYALSILDNYVTDNESKVEIIQID